MQEGAPQKNQHGAGPLSLTWTMGQYLLTLPVFPLRGRGYKLEMEVVRWAVTRQRLRRRIAHPLTHKPTAIAYMPGSGVPVTGVISP